MASGTIINIQKYSVHDGPGIRTTVFLKGCPLSCWWCHNPESQNHNHEIMFFEEKCTGCGLCMRRCPEKAIRIVESALVIDEHKCILCGRCADFCPNNAREHVGKDMTVEDLMREIIKDEPFYEESNGGVTFSGGEPLIHTDFLKEVLKRCKERGIHTAVDTSGYVQWEKLKELSDQIDLFLYDIKLINNEKHKKYTGVENNIILDNLKKLSDGGANIYVRIPIIAGVNDGDEDIDDAIGFLSKINQLQVNLLSYHKFGLDKYRRLKMNYRLTGMEQPSEGKMAEIVDKFSQKGYKVKIGG